MCDELNKDVGLLQGRTVDIEEKWGNGRRKPHTMNDYLLQDLGKTVFPTDPLARLSPGNLSPFILSHKQRYIALKSLEGVPFTVAMWIVV